MRCIICDGNKWKNVDEYRFVKKGMSVCEGCGFVSYPTLYKTKEEIIEFYRNDYRSPPTSANLYSGQKKLHYHAEMLVDLIKEYKESDKEVDVLEVGSAFGMFLNWFKKAVPKSKVTGTEITTSFKRIAKHEFDIDLVDDFSDDQKFDLICSYKVAEHQLDADKELQRYHKCLKEGGRLYIGVPCWFNTMHNFGVGGWDIEYYYSTNHINVWTRKTFESLLKKTGFKIVKQDHEMYDSVYICEKIKPQTLKQKDFDGMDHILTQLKRIKNANDAFCAGKYMDATAIWNDFPSAIINGYETNRKAFHDNGFEWIEKNIIEAARKMCNDSPAVLAICTDIYVRYGKLDSAIKMADMGLRKQPRSPQFILALASCFNQIGEKEPDAEQKKKFFLQSRDLYRFLIESSQQHKAEAINWIYSLDAKIEV